MRTFAVSLMAYFFCTTSIAQKLKTPFELSNQKETTTYQECIAFYKQLSAQYPIIKVETKGITDAGKPLHLIKVSTQKSFSPKQWHQQGKIVILINNGIHPGEPDGIDASMLLVRDIAEGRKILPSNIVLTIIPIYNIGGSLNRNSTTRVNQDGPLSYGFRGNAQNLDLNRDFIKCDSKEAIAFTKIFHEVNPDIFIDNHVSDGADYQHTMTLLTTQHNKLGGQVGNFLHQIFEPALYKSMEQKNWPMCPYVNFETANPTKGWPAFYDAPRYSSGYAALFGTMAFVPETHMLKPFEQRVKSTYALMETMIEQSSLHAQKIKQNKQQQVQQIAQQKKFALTWKLDTLQFDSIYFRGYIAAQKASEVSGLPRLFYDKSKPNNQWVKFNNYYTGENMVQKPKAYVIPQGWHSVINLLQANNIQCQQLTKDTVIAVTAYHINQYKAATRPYEKHFKHSNVTLKKSIQEVQFLEGDYIVFTGFYTDRFLVEVLEPEADDSYFKWNFFDAILQQKEGYSDYRWEDVAADYLAKNPALKKQLDTKKLTDTLFAQNAHAQLDFVYKNSPYYEKAHLRYPIFRIE